MHWTVLILPGVMDASLGLTLSLLQAAQAVQAHASRSEASSSSAAAPLSWSLWAPTEPDADTAAAQTVLRHTGAGLPLQVSTQLQPPPSAPHGIVIPGCYLATVAQVDAWLHSPEVQTAVQALQALRVQSTESGQKGIVHVASSCVGGHVLAQAGWLHGRRATTTWWLAADFRRRFPRVELDTSSMVVHHGPCTTAGAALAQADLMHHLLLRHQGPALAQQVGRYMLLQHRSHQSAYMQLGQLAQQDPLLTQAMVWIRRHLHQPFQLPDLAAAVHTTPRTLARRVQAQLGLTPLGLVQRLRVEHAVHRLQTSQDPLEAIALEVGYQNPDPLRKLLLRETGQAAQHWRANGGF